MPNRVRVIPVNRLTPSASKTSSRLVSASGDCVTVAPGYDSAGKLIKRFEVVSAQKIEDRWYLKQMRVEQIDPKSNKVTARTYLEINK